jgi:hypothetical protein
MWRRSRRFTNQQYPNLEFRQTNHKPTTPKAGTPTKQTRNQQHPKLELQQKNQKPTTPKAGTPTKKPQTNNTQSWNSKKQTSRRRRSNNNRTIYDENKKELQDRYFTDKAPMQ